MAETGQDLIPWVPHPLSRVSPLRITAGLWDPNTCSSNSRRLSAGAGSGKGKGLDGGRPGEETCNT